MKTNRFSPYKAHIERTQTSILCITLQYMAMRVNVSYKEVFTALKPFKMAGLSFRYFLKDGSVVNLWHIDQAQRDAVLSLLVNEYLPELWEEFVHLISEN